MNSSVDILTKCRELMDYSNVQLSAGTASSAKLKDAVMKMVRAGPPISIKTAQALLGMFAGTAFSASDCADIAAEINDKVDFFYQDPRAPAPQAGEDANGSRPAAPAQPDAPAGVDAGAFVHGQSHGKRFQENMWFQKYIGASLYKMMVDETVAWTDVLEAIGRRFVEIGLLWPSEPTCLHVRCVFLAAHCKQGSPHFDDALLAIERRQQIAAEAVHQRGRNPEVKMTIMQYPNDLASFRMQHPSVYTKAFPNGEDFQCPLNDRLIASVRSRLPCRSTHSSMRQPAHRRGQRALPGLAPHALARRCAASIRGSDLFGRPADSVYDEISDGMCDGLLPGLVINRDVAARRRVSSPQPLPTSTGVQGIAHNNDCCSGAMGARPWS